MRPVNKADLATNALIDGLRNLCDRVLPVRNGEKRLASARRTLRGMRSPICNNKRLSHWMPMDAFGAKAQTKPSKSSALSQQQAAS